MNTRTLGTGKSRPAARPSGRGFTLIETALATVIIGVGVLAIVAAQQAFHSQNGWSTHASIAMRLGNEIREMTFNLPRHDPVTGDLTWGPEANESTLDDLDDVDDFDGAVFSAADGSGPVNALRQIIPNMAGWSQTVVVRNVDPHNVNSLQPNFSTIMLKVTVIVEYQGPYDAAPREMTRVSWITPN